MALREQLLFRRAIKKGEHQRDTPETTTENSRPSLANFQSVIPRYSVFYANSRKETSGFKGCRLHGPVPAELLSHPANSS